MTATDSIRGNATMSFKVLVRPAKGDPVEVEFVATVDLGAGNVEQKKIEPAVEAAIRDAARFLGQRLACLAR